MEDEFCQKQFLFLGVHPMHPLKRWRCIFNSSTIICLSILTVFKLYYDNDLEALQSLICVNLALVKYLMMAFQSKAVRELMKASEHFWKMNVTDDQITTFLNYLKRVKNIYKRLWVLTILTFGVKPFIIKGSSIFNCYVSPEIPYSVDYVLEYYVLVMGASLFMSVNIFICSVIISVVVQFRLLNVEIKNLNLGSAEEDYDTDRFVRELKSIIQHQQFLMRFVKNLNKLLSVPMALLMIGSVSLMCLNMYVLSTSEISVVVVGKLFISSSAVTTEFFLVYGLPAQLLMDESAATADIIYYECKWYLPKLRPFRKYFLLMIFRCQRNVCMRAGNYLIINNRTILLMLRTAYSFFTFLQKVT